MPRKGTRELVHATRSNLAEGGRLRQVVGPAAVFGNVAVGSVSGEQGGCEWDLRRVPVVGAGRQGGKGLPESSGLAVWPIPLPLEKMSLVK